MTNGRRHVQSWQGNAHCCCSASCNLILTLEDETKPCPAVTLCSAGPLPRLHHAKVSSNGNYDVQHLRRGRLHLTDSLPRCVAGVHSLLFAVHLQALLHLVADTCDGLHPQRAGLWGRVDLLHAACNTCDPSIGYLLDITAPRSRRAEHALAWQHCMSACSALGRASALRCCQSDREVMRACAWLVPRRGDLYLAAACTCHAGLLALPHVPPPDGGRLLEAVALRRLHVKSPHCQRLAGSDEPSEQVTYLPAAHRPSSRA